MFGKVPAGNPLKYREYKELIAVIDAASSPVTPKARTVVKAAMLRVIELETEEKHGVRPVNVSMSAMGDVEADYLRRQGFIVSAHFNPKAGAEYWKILKRQWYEKNPPKAGA